MDQKATEDLKMLSWILIKQFKISGQHQSPVDAKIVLEDSMYKRK